MVYYTKLETYKGQSTRYTCPRCEKRREFVRYIYTANGEHVHETVGKCNRLQQCGYHYTPSQYFADTKDRTFIPPPPTKTFVIEKPPTYTPPAILQATLCNYAQNNFMQFLARRFGTDAVKQVLDKYAIGTTEKGGTVFWLIDKNGKIRGGKVMFYNRQTCKRNGIITWYHAITKEADYNFKPCFFGEHLVKDSGELPICIVESEKTAIIASLYLPNMVWLASSGLNGLNSDKAKALKGKRVILYPDLGAGFDVWKQKAAAFGFAVCDYLESIATDTERNAGLDIADYLLAYDIANFTLSLPPPPPPPPSQAMSAYNPAIEAAPFLFLKTERGEIKSGNRISSNDIAEYLERTPLVSSPFARNYKKLLIALKRHLQSRERRSS